jgi:hypothetical protein
MLALKLNLNYIIYVYVIFNYNQNTVVDVAQLVEHQVVALGAVGSIPTIHPTL